MTTRGLRLHNPFNIEKNPNIKWQGAVNPGSDNVFVEFISDLMGLRAGFKNLITQSKEGVDTVAKLVTKYCPPKVMANAGGLPETNNTSAYIKDICEKLQVGTDDTINTDDYSTLFALGSAIICHEQGCCPFNKTQLDAAIKLAGCSNSPNPKVASQPETHAALGAGIVGAITLVGQVSSAASPAISLLQQAKDLMPILAISLSFLMAVYLGYTLYTKYKEGNA